MSTSPIAQQHADDYRSSMQAAAAGFIKRHQGEHLDNDRLYDRTVSYLVHACGVPVFMADRIAHLAMTEQSLKGVRWIGIDMANGPDLQPYQAHFLARLGPKQTARPTR